MSSLVAHLSESVEAFFLRPLDRFFLLPAHDARIVACLRSVALWTLSVQNRVVAAIPRRSQIERHAFTLCGTGRRHPNRWQSEHRISA